MSGKAREQLEAEKAGFQAYLDNIGASIDIEQYYTALAKGKVKEANAMLETASWGIQVEFDTLNETRAELFRIADDAYSNFDAPIKAIYQNEAYDSMTDD